MVDEAMVRRALQMLSDEQLKNLQEKLIERGIPGPRILANEFKERKQNVGGFTLCGTLQTQFLEALHEVMTDEQKRQSVEENYDCIDLKGELTLFMPKKKREAIATVPFTDEELAILSKKLENGEITHDDFCDIALYHGSE